MLKQIMLSLRLNNNFGNLLKEWDKSFFSEDSNYWRRSAVNYKEKEDSYEYFIPLAGFKKEDVSVKVSDGIAYVSAGEKQDKTSYSFYLPENVDYSKITSKMEEGLLSINVEKKENHKTIDVNIT